MMKQRIAPVVALFFATLATVRGAEISLATAPPVVVKTVPVAGSTDVSADLTEIVVTYSKPMLNDSWSWSTLAPANFPETTGQPHYRSDGRTCVLPVRLLPGTFYAIWLNSDGFHNFKDRDGQPAVPYLLTFDTASSNSVAEPGAVEAIPKPHELPGQLLFHGQYRHRSRNADMDTPGELWVNQESDGSLQVLATIPGSNTKEFVSGDSRHRIARHEIQRLPSGDYAGYHVRLDFVDGAAHLTRRGVRQDQDRQVVESPDGAVFDPNSRPDSYAAANLLLRGFEIRSGEVKDFRAFDWDRSGDAFADYTIRVRHAGKESVTVPAGTFDANHLVLTQTSSANTWFRKQAGHVTDFWVLDNHVIVRVLRHREPYEILLINYTAPETNSSNSDPLQSSAEKLRQAAPVMTAIREHWSVAVRSIQTGDAETALAALRVLAPRIEEFRRIIRGTTLESGAAEALQSLKPIVTALEAGDPAAAQAAMQPMLALGEKMEEQVKDLQSGNPRTIAR